jgi:hypothetical protein
VAVAGAAPATLTRCQPEDEPVVVTDQVMLTSVPAAFSQRIPIRSGTTPAVSENA